MKGKEMDSLFVCKSYTKDELVKLYLPGYTLSTALKKFNAWIGVSQKFREAFYASGATLQTRIYTLEQVRIIVAHLGEP